jgi:Transcription initiation factor IIF, alpha subunit (TFIIF-alpha)
MAGKQRLFADDRWMMRDRKAGGADKLSQLKQDLLAGSDAWEAVPLQVRRLENELHGEIDEKEALEFEAIFEDDEEIDADIDNQEEIEPKRNKFLPSNSMPNPLAGQSAFEMEDVLMDGLPAPQYSSLTRSGKQLRKTLQTYDAAYRSDEEEDQEEEQREKVVKQESNVEMSMEQLALIAEPKVQIPTSQLRAPIKYSSSVSSGPTKSPFNLPSSQAAPSSSSVVKRLKMHPPVTPPGQSPLLISSPSMSPAPMAQGIVDALILTEQDILVHLKTRAMPTKELIALMKPRLKAHPSNKDLFRTLLKKLATVNATAITEQDRLLELKPEYK